MGRLSRLFCPFSVSTTDTKGNQGQKKGALLALWSAMRPQGPRRSMDKGKAFFSQLQTSANQHYQFALNKPQMT